jgi:hypothetical protein
MILGMISCFCITRGDRPGLLSEAVEDFARQTFPDRELVILHDGDEAVHARVGAIVAAHAGASIRSEDTLQTHALLQAEASKAFRVSRLSGSGWCYIYRYHGGNAWDAAHHRAISVVKHMTPARLLPRLALLRDRLKEYRPELPAMRTLLGAEIEYVIPDAEDGQTDPGKRNCQAAFFLRRTAPTPDWTSDDGSGKDVQIA